MLVRKPTEFAALASEQFIQLGLLDSNLLPELLPTLHVSYLRNYFQDAMGMRLTIDSDINFYNVDASETLQQTLPIHFAKKIIELKFSPELKPAAEHLIKSLHIIPKRCSKYLQGLSMNGVAVYI